jgi:hypothetical protein
LGAVRRNFINLSPVALPARFLKKSAAVSATPTFSATAAAIHWFKDTPSSIASRWAAFFSTERWVRSFGESCAAISYI